MRLLRLIKPPPRAAMRVGVIIVTAGLLCYLVAKVVAGFVYAPVLNDIVAGSARAARIRAMEFALDDDSGRRVTGCVAYSGTTSSIPTDDYWRCSLEDGREDSGERPYVLGLIDTLSLQWRSGCPAPGRDGRIIAMAYRDSVPPGSHRRLLEETLGRCNGTHP